MPLLCSANCVLTEVRGICIASIVAATICFSIAVFKGPSEMSESVAWYAYIVVWAGSSAAAVRGLWKDFEPDWRALWRFHITDFWAMVASLLPSFLLLRYVLI